MRPCLTVDVEDWYDGMANLGHPVRSSRPQRSGLEALIELLESTPQADHNQITLFVVGKYAREVASELSELARAGHELASHSVDHGAVPDDPDRLEAWLRQGREQVEDLVQRPVEGFRSPRFALPPSIPLAQYRDILARAGFSYVSDRHRLGPASPVTELPVLQWRGVPVGGGSYQRLLPRRVAARLVQRPFAPDPHVLYYHSYDFGDVMPPLREDRSPAVLKYSVGRSRVPEIFREVLLTAGSIPCREAAHAV